MVWLGLFYFALFLLAEAFLLLGEVASSDNGTCLCTGFDLICFVLLQLSLVSEDNWPPATTTTTTVCVKDLVLFYCSFLCYTWESWLPATTMILWASDRLSTFYSCMVGETLCRDVAITRLSVLVSSELVITCILGKGTKNIRRSKFNLLLIL